MSAILVVLLLSCVKSIWGFIIGVLMVFFGLVAAQEDSHVISMVLVVLGVILVFISVGW